MRETVYDSEEARLPYAGGRPLARHSAGEAVESTHLTAPRDAVRWGPIVAGLLTALGSFLLFMLFLLAIGAATVRAAPVGGDAAEAGVLTAAVALLAFFLGGFVAGGTAGVTGRGAGSINGFLVWALGVLLILVLSAFGVGQLFGGAGELFAQYRALGSPQPGGVDPETVAASVRAAAVPGFLSLALPAAAATLGGFLGARDGVGRGTPREGARR